MIAVTRTLANEILGKNINRLRNSIDYKKTRLAGIKAAEDLLVGKVKAKDRQLFNVPLPILPGLVDSLSADLDDPVNLKIRANPQKSFKAVKGINQSLAIQRKSFKPGARWDYADRISRKNAIHSGRGFLKYFTTRDPYTSNISAPSYAYMHTDALGGILENHLFCGEEGILKTKKKLEDGVSDGVYDERGVELVLERMHSKEYQEKMSAFQDDQFHKFKALGLDPEQHNYVGEETAHFCEFVSEDYGERWYMLFDPWNRVWIRFERFVDIQPSGYYPWTSYATHEDDENFWSISILRDIFYPIADSSMTLFNQDLTNREKRNLNSRAYDRDMFKDLQKLDRAQFKPDALVPADTMGGTRRISEGLYRFDYPEISGTINLIDWLTGASEKATGVYDLGAEEKGARGRGRNQNVVFAHTQQLAKRIDYRSHSYTEAWGELVFRYVDGIKTNMSEKEAINLLGPELGVGFKDELKKINLLRDDLEIISTKQQNQEDALRKQQKAESLKLLAQDQDINPDWRRRHILGDIGGWEPEEIEDALDLRGLGPERDQLAAADEAIRDILRGREPEMAWEATTVFQRKILDFERKHHAVLAGKGLEMKFLEYVRKHSPIVMENMAQMAMRQKAAAHAALQHQSPAAKERSPRPRKIAPTPAQTAVPLPVGGFNA